MALDELCYVIDGLLQEAPAGPRLCAARCGGCNAVYFPRPTHCRNPACTAPALEGALLEGRGQLYSFTIQRYRPPALFRMDDWEPYALGLVELPEGIRVMGMLSGFDLDNIAIGQEVKLVSERLFTDAQRGEVMTYKFAPATALEDSL
jgi:uncharacterized protein